MNNVFKAELYKIQKSKSTLAFFLVLLAYSLLNLGLYFLMKVFFPEDLPTATEGLLNTFITFSTDAIFQYGSLIYIAGVVTHMYTFGPMKQLVATGNSRRSIIVGQFCSMGFILSLMAIVGGIIYAICGNHSFALGTVDTTRYIISIFGMLANIWCLAAFFLFFAHLLNNIGAAIAIGLILMMGGGLAVSYLAGLIKAPWLSDYWLFNMLSDTVDMTLKTAEQIKYILIVAALSIVFIELTALVFKRKEIK